MDNLSDAMDAQLATDDQAYALSMLPVMPAPVRRYVERLQKERQEIIDLIEPLATGLLHAYEGNCPDEVAPTERDRNCTYCQILMKIELL